MATSGSAHWDRHWSAFEITGDSISNRLIDGSQQLEIRLLYNFLKERGLSSSTLLELGGGLASTALLFSTLGVAVEIVDFSTTALEKSAASFATIKRRATFHRWDVLEPIPSEIAGQFDAVVSIGVAEHFDGMDRDRVVAAHGEALKPGGLAVLTVPNRQCWPYRIVKWFREKTGTWGVGMEIPYSAEEIQGICLRQGFTDVQVFRPFSLRRDVREYGLGFLYAIKILLPPLLQRLAARNKPNTRTRPATPADLARLLVGHLETPAGKILDAPTSSLLIIVFRKPAL